MSSPEQQEFEIKREIPESFTQLLLRKRHEAIINDKIELLIELKTSINSHIIDEKIKQLKKQL
jgi:hypothetical protein